MSESFVDLSYRGLALGKRIKLTQVRPTSGYLEIPTPMPVGTTIGIATDDGVQLEAVVAEVHEQVGGSDRPPGMRIKPTLGVAAADAWWKARASGAEEAAVTVQPPRGGKVADVIDDGKPTLVMAAISPESSGSVDAVIADVETVPSRSALSRSTLAGHLPPQTESKSDASASDTQMMDAVDLAALGLASQSAEMAAVKPEDYADPPAAPDKPEAGGKPKRKRKRR